MYFPEIEFIMHPANRCLYWTPPNGGSVALPLPLLLAPSPRRGGQGGEWQSAECPEESKRALVESLVREEEDLLEGELVVAEGLDHRP